MRTPGAPGIVVIAVIAAIAGAGAQQAARERPTLGTGIVDVQGTVGISDMPPVAVSTLPRIDVATLPPVTVAQHGFVQLRSRYRVVWADGSREDVTIAGVGEGGWVQVEARRWLNLDAARSVERLSP